MTSYFIRTIYFIPVSVWELEISKRIDIFDKFTIKDAVSFSNITQMMYIILGVLVFTIYSSLKFEKSKIIKFTYYSLALVLFIAVLQLLFYYTGYYNIYLNIFYSIDPTGKNSVLAFQEFYGIKRINSVLVEPSIFGYYVTLTLMFLLLFDKEKLNNNKKTIVIFSVILVLLSTSGTGYLGLILIYILYSLYNKQYINLIVLFIIFFAITSFIFIFYYDYISLLIELKSSSFVERFFYGFTLPIQSLIKMPLFGLAVGTDRPTIMLMNLIVSIGIVGTILLVFIGKITFYKNREVKFFLFFLFLIGITVPDFRYIFLWIYLGLLQNTFYRKTE
jgi:hypothetical protein